MTIKVLPFEGCNIVVTSGFGITSARVQFTNINAHYDLPMVGGEISADEYINHPNVRDEIFKSACAYGNIAMNFLDCEKYMHNILDVIGGYDA